ncbi:MAG: Zn-dependent hydrolase, partial [Acetobacteraceae bacterium]|nr:Zn-dependent hydrolase [Acetobacteraceae bacterium]
MDLLSAVFAERDRAARLFDHLREDGRDEPGVTRDPYGAGEQRAHATVAAEAGRLGLDVARDAAANLHMTLRGRDRSAP